MWLVFGHYKNRGANIGTEIYTRVEDIAPNSYIRLYVERRDYKTPGKHKPWSVRADNFTLSPDDRLTPKDTELLSDEQIISFNSFDYNPASGKDYAKVGYNFPGLNIAHIYWGAVDSPWRPAFDIDGINASAFKGNVSELMVEKLRGRTILAYALVPDKSIGKDVVYLCIKGAQYKLIARIVDGKVIPNNTQNNSFLSYLGGINSAEDSVTFLARNVRVAHEFRSVPTSYGGCRALSSTLQQILRNEERYKRGDISKGDLSGLVLTEFELMS